MPVLPAMLLIWCVVFVFAGLHSDAGWDWANLVCTEAPFLCAQPYWLGAMAGITALPAIYHEMRT